MASQLSKEAISRLIDAAKQAQGTYFLGEADNVRYAIATVGAAVLTEDGSVYTGVSIDLACSIGFCAEQGAMAQMLRDRKSRILAVVAVGEEGKILPPCGRCREFMAQLCKENMEADVILSPDSAVKLKDLIPYYWNP